MEKITIYDDLLSTSDIKKCIEITKQPNWGFGHTSGNNIGTPFWFMQLIDNPFFSQHIKSIIEQKTGKKYKLNRVYANGHTYGQGGSFHQDDIDTNCWTFCLYINPISKDIVDEIGGHIQFKIPNMENFVVDIEPLYNRGVLFPSNYYHRGTCYSRYVNDLRISIAWKFTIL